MFFMVRNTLALQAAPSTRPNGPLNDPTAPSTRPNDPNSPWYGVGHFDKTLATQRRLDRARAGRFGVLTRDVEPEFGS